MWSIIHDTTIVTADEQCTVHYDAAIAIAEDRIVALGPNAELLARYPAAERIDGRGKAVMVDGRWLMRDSIVRTMDEEAIVREADRIGRTAWRRLFEERPDLRPPPGLNIAVYED